MKVVLAGASGAGKTTLALALSKELNLKFIEQSAGLIILPDDKARLKEVYGYNGNAGQRGVINKSHDDASSFGLDFQECILKARKKILLDLKDESFVLDRSPLDPGVFYLNQVVHNYHQSMANSFLEHCMESFVEAKITHVIKIDLNWMPIEDNGSRVNNWFFQKKIDLLFDFVIDLLHQHLKEKTTNHKLKIARINTWDWDKRVQAAKDFINHIDA